jgi:predicted amidohydrolase YtcJ
MTAEGVNSTIWSLAQGFDRTRQSGFQNNMLEIMDQVSTTRPVCLADASGHYTYVNSKGLEVLGIVCPSTDPLVAQKCNGTFSELSLFDPIKAALAVMPVGNLEKTFAGLCQGADILRNRGGYLTTSDPLVNPNLVPEYVAFGKFPEAIFFIIFF